MNEAKLKAVYALHDVDKEKIRTRIKERAEGEQSVPHRVRIKPLFAACAAVALVACCIFGFAVVAEAKEYEQAVGFFNEHELSTEGLTRSDIKAVYKDITMKTYSYEKTIELLNRLSVEMYSTQLGSVDRESLDKLWNNINNSQPGILPEGTEKDEKTIRYDIRYEDRPPAENEDGYNYSSVVIVKYEGDKELWSYTVPYDMYVSVSDNTIIYGDGIIVFGYKDCYSTYSGNACVFMLGGDGQLLWEYNNKTLGSKFEAAIVADDEIVLFGGIPNGNNTNRLFTVLDMNGNVKQNKTTVCDCYQRYETVVKLGDCYLAKRYVLTSDHTSQPSLVTISEQGDELNEYIYSQDGANYLIQDITYFQGKIYLSALMPNMTDEEFHERFDALSQEFGESWRKACEQNKSVYDMAVPDEYNIRLSKLFAEAYTAALLVCDENAVITRAYSVENARVGTLSVTDDGKLNWQVFRVDDAKNAPPTISSYSVTILTTEFAFMFDESGAFIEKNEIGAYKINY